MRFNDLNKWWIATTLACSGPAPAGGPDAALADAAGKGAVDAAPSDGPAAADAGAEVAADATPSSWVLPPSAPPGSLKVMTYNVMCSFCTNKAHPEWVQAWKDRLPWLRDVVLRFDPDLIGLQELQAQLPTEGGVPEVDQLIGLTKAYESFHYRFKPGDEVEFDYPDAVVLWRASRFTKIADGVVWLSPTPDKPYSTGFAKIQFARLLVWVKLYDKVRQREFVFASTHFDNNAPSQELSSPLALKTLGPLAAQVPLIATGDFNASPGSKAFALLTAGQPGVAAPWQDTWALATTHAVVHNQPSTPPWDPTQRIDHIFVAGSLGFQVAWWGIDRWLYGATPQAPSDHEGAIVAHLDW